MSNPADSSTAPAGAVVVSEIAGGAPQPSVPGPTLPRIHRSARFPLVIGGVAVIPAVGAIVLHTGHSGFPGQAPAEDLLADGLILDMVAATIALIICAIILALRRSSSPPRAVSLDWAALVAAILGAISFLAWGLLGGFGAVGDLTLGVRLRYMSDVPGAFLAGVPWVQAFVFGALGFRRHASAVSNVLALAALVLATIVLVAVCTSTVIYGRGLSD